ncbi:MAG: hypothetical protein OEV94_09750 [Deltaproteobacteria bacterium]|nr:hypothetical protein [Deltaproteobacteria bacterium]
MGSVESHVGHVHTYMEFLGVAMLMVIPLGLVIFLYSFIYRNYIKEDRGQHGG